jgi:hypothetical protein
MTKRKTLAQRLYDAAQNEQVKAAPWLAELLDEAADSLVVVDNATDVVVFPNADNGVYAFCTSADRVSMSHFFDKRAKIVIDPEESECEPR